MDDIIRVKLLRKYFPLKGNTEIMGLIRFKSSFVKNVFHQISERIKSDDKFVPHIIFLIDTSLSMNEQDNNGSKIENLKKSLRNFVEYGYLDNYYLSFISFDENARAIFKYLKVRDNKELILKRIDEIRAKGYQTYAYTGFSLIGEEIDLYSRNNVNRIIYFTDGEDFDTALAIEEAKKLVYEKFLTITSVGVGIEYNEEFLEEVANIGKGGFYHLKDVNEFFTDIKDELREVSEEIIAKTEIVKLFYPSSVEPIEVFKVGRGVVKLEIDKGEILCGNLTDKDKIFFRFKLKNIKREGKYTILNAFIRFKSGDKEFEKEFSFRATLTNNRKLIDSYIDREVIEANKQIVIYKKIKQAQHYFNMGKEKEARLIINEISPVIKSLNPDDEICQILEDIKSKKTITSEITRTLLSYTRTKTITKTDTA